MRPEPSLATIEQIIPPPRRHRGLIWLERLLWLGFVILISALIIGYVSFVEMAVGYEAKPLAKADGIVSVTGGEHRLQDGIDLMLSKSGRRMLISGVNPKTGAKELAQRIPSAADLFGCCIDLDYRALNTRGNAIEAVAWARRHSFSTLIIVTSRWHMPRLLLELKREAPDLVFIAHPVDDQRFRPKGWWKHPASLKVMGLEYGKTLLALVKIRLEDAVNVKAPIAKEGSLT